VTANFTASLQSIHHIVFLAQENRSFDSYFGALREYWAQNGVPDQPFNGLPQFNPAGDPNAGPPPTNPGCDPAFPFIAPSTNLYCQINSASPAVASFHFQSTCVENPSPSWNESHRAWNVHDPLAGPPPLLDGFLDAAANDGRQHTTTVNGVTQPTPYFDTDGVRAMGYYDGGDLNYYYALATAFGTSDNFFAPVLTRTPPNRYYLIAGTSQGHVYATGGPTITASPIFEKLQAAGVTWKIYVNQNTIGPDCRTDTSAACLIKHTYVKDFAFSQTILSTYPQNIVPIDQFKADAQSGNLPQVVQIEPASDAGLDEHPSDNDPAPGQPACCNPQNGAAYVKSLIDAVMNGPSWQDTVFILTFDEPGGFFDHVPPVNTVSPDGVLPKDLHAGDVCTMGTGPTCDFVYTGYRVPLVVISPFSKKNYVSHTAADETAILKFIETRFGLRSLTERDKAQQTDMTEFFDFTTAPWKTPPGNLPSQNTSGQCFVSPPPTSP